MRNFKHFMRSDLKLNLDAIIEYCRVQVDGKGTSDYRQQEISDNYEIDEDTRKMVHVQKTTHEVITPHETPVYDDVKVELMRMMLNKFLVDENDGTTDMTLQTNIVYNTLMTNNFIVEK